MIFTVLSLKTLVKDLLGFNLNKRYFEKIQSICFMKIDDSIEITSQSFVKKLHHELKFVFNTYTI